MEGRKDFVADLKTVYQATTLELAAYHLDEVEQKWVKPFPAVFTSWRSHWEQLTEYFKYPPAIRKLIYTTNAVEGYHRMVRRMTKTKGAFTSETAMLKLVCLATLRIHDKWKAGIAGWHDILNGLSLYHYFLRIELTLTQFSKHSRLCPRIGKRVRQTPKLCFSNIKWYQ
jgi:transposase-like protein